MITDSTESIFYKVIKRKISIECFEQWVYENKSLENELPEGIYVEIISINFKDKFALSEIKRVLKPLVNFDKIETAKIKSYLESIIKRDENCVGSLLITYELYCDGLDFFRKLGLKYGLLIACPPSEYYIETFDELSTEEQQKLLDEIYPSVIEDAQNALFWLENDLIRIKNSEQESRYLEFEDYRGDSEKLKSEF